MVNNQASNDEVKKNTAESLEINGEFHVMFDYLQDRSAGKLTSKKHLIEQRKKKTFPLWLIWIFFGVIIIGFAGIIYLKPELILTFFTEQPDVNIKIQPSGDNKQLNNQSQINQNEAPRVIKAEVKKGLEIVLTAELYLPTGSLNNNSLVSLSGESVVVDDDVYHVIGGNFRISSESQLLKPATLKITYLDSEIESSWKDSLKIGYLGDNKWMILPTTNNINQNTLDAELPSFFSGIFAPIIPKEKISKNNGDNQTITPNIIIGEDFDNDGLTDKEEQLYQTDKSNPDTDKDSMPDGLEIVNLYSPTQGYGTLLSNSGLVKNYINSKFGYSLFYLSSFVVKSMPESEDQEIIILGDNGEFFNINVVENPEALPVESWYKKQLTDFNGQPLKSATVDGNEAVWSLDGSTIYISHNNQIYVFSYNTGGNTKAEFKSTFFMMIKSFKFVEPNL